MKQRVLLTRPYQAPIMEALALTFDLELGAEEGVCSREALLNGVKGKHALISHLTDQVDVAVLDAAPDLRIVANYAVGYNNIDVDAAICRGILVTHTPDVLTDATADIAFALLMTLARRIVEAHQYTVSGKFEVWDANLMLGTDLVGKTVGIVGFGRIGQALARRCLGFGLRVVYHEPQRVSEQVESEYCATWVALDDLLAQSDFVSLHVPLNERTYHLMGEEALARMKPEAFLINTSRGPVVDEAALVSCLIRGQIGGVGLDVYEFEPRIPEPLLNMPNVVLLPHVGSATLETRTRMAQMTLDALNQRFAGQVPTHLIPEWKRALAQGKTFRSS